MTSLIDVDVVIPAFNAARYIAQTIESVLSQTSRPRRITVVNDRSQDNTSGIVESIAKNATCGVEIVLMENIGPQGPSAARNTAISNTPCEFIAFQDADDLMLPHQLATLHVLLTSDDSAVLSFADTELFNESAVILRSLLTKSGFVKGTYHGIGNMCISGQEMFLLLMRGGVFCTSACLCRVNAVRRAGLFDELMMHCEDTDLFIRMSLMGGFVFSTELVNRKRVHGENLSHPRHQLKFERGTVRVLGKLGGYICDEGVVRPMISAEHRAQLEGHLDAAVDGYLYHASRQGWAAYAEAAKLCGLVGRGSAVSRIRHILRLLTFVRQQPG